MLKLEHRPACFRKLVRKGEELVGDGEACLNQFVGVFQRSEQEVLELDPKSIQTLKKLLKLLMTAKDSYKAAQNLMLGVGTFAKEAKQFVSYAASRLQPSSFALTPTPALALCRTRKRLLVSAKCCRK